MKICRMIALIIILPLISISAAAGGEQIALPKPDKEGKLPLEQALEQRRSVRSYGQEPVTLEQLSQILWAAQGITKRMDKPSRWPESREWFGGLRTAPSAGALYPLELYVAAGDVTGLDPGLYRYRPQSHSLVMKSPEDLRAPLASAALGQRWVEECALDIIITAVYERTERKYGERAELYVPVEVGAVMQNIHLQCEPLGLGTVIIGAFEDEKVAEAISLPESERAMGIMPVGKKTGE